MNDIDAAGEWLDSWVGRANTQAQRSAELSRRVAALTGNAEGRDGMIRVAVRSAGQVERLEFDDRVHEFARSPAGRGDPGGLRRAQADRSGR